MTNTCLLNDGSNYVSSDILSRAWLFLCLIACGYMLSRIGCRLGGEPGEPLQVE